MRFLETEYLNVTCLTKGEAFLISLFRLCNMSGSGEDVFSQGSIISIVLLSRAFVFLFKAVSITVEKASLIFLKSIPEVCE